jgi:hypothetical protein
MRSEYTRPIHVVIGVDLAKSTKHILLYVLHILLLSQLVASILAAEKEVYKNTSASFHVDPLLACKVSFAIVK